MATWRECCNSYVIKEIIGLRPSGGETPPAQTCLYSINIRNTNCDTFSGYDFNGYNLADNYASSIGGYSVTDGYDSCVPLYSDTGNQLSFFYLGQSAPPDLVVKDNFANYTTYTWMPICCNFGCLTLGTISLVNSPYFWGYFEAIGIMATNFANYYGPLDFSDVPSAQLTFDTLLQAYQPQAYCVVSDVGGGDFRITFYDIYYNPTLLNNGFNLWYDVFNVPTSESFNFITC